jgi:PKD repeat protein
VDKLRLKDIKKIRIAGGRLLKAKSITEFGNSDGMQFSLYSSDNLLGYFEVEENRKLCLGTVYSRNISISGNTIFVADPSSTIENSSGWTLSECAQVLYSNFSVINACAKGVTSFQDKSEGNPDYWSWSFGDNTSAVEEQSPEHIYTTEGTYSVQLNVKNQAAQHINIKQVNVIKSTLNEPTIILSNEKLRTTAFAPNYQWYFNGMALEGETNSSLENFSNPGDYYIEIYNTSCRMRSSIYSVEVTGLNQEVSSINSVFIYPNPAKNFIYVGGNDNLTVNEVSIIDPRGSQIMATINFAEGINLTELPKGLYFVKLKVDSKIITQKLIID